MSKPPKAFPILSLIAVLAWLGANSLAFTAGGWVSSWSPHPNWQLYGLIWLVLNAVTSAFLNQQLDKPSSERTVLLFMLGILVMGAVLFAGCCVALSKI